MFPPINFGIPCFVIMIVIEEMEKEGERRHVYLSIINQLP